MTNPQMASAKRAITAAHVSNTNGHRRPGRWGAEPTIPVLFPVLDNTILRFVRPFPFLAVPPIVKRLAKVEKTFPEDFDDDSSKQR